MKGAELKVRWFCLLLVFAIFFLACGCSDKKDKTVYEEIYGSKPPYQKQLDKIEKGAK